MALMIMQNERTGGIICLSSRSRDMAVERKAFRSLLPLSLPLQTYNRRLRVPLSGPPPASCFPLNTHTVVSFSKVSARIGEM